MGLPSRSRLLGEGQRRTHTGEEECSSPRAGRASRPENQSSTVSEASEGAHYSRRLQGGPCPDLSSTKVRRDEGARSSSCSTGLVQRLLEHHDKRGEYPLPALDSVTNEEGAQDPPQSASQAAGLAVSQIAGSLGINVLIGARPVALQAAAEHRITKFCNKR